MRLLTWILLPAAVWGQNCNQTSVGFGPFADPYPRAYQGQTVSLYPSGNQAPAAFQALGLQQAALIVPRDAAGSPDPAGKIVLLSIGMSNTTMEFTAFLPLAMADGARNTAVLPVDGAVSGVTAAAIVAQPDQYWQQVETRLRAAGVTDAQVQAVWLKEADAEPSLAFPKDAQQLQSELATIAQLSRARFPNLKIVYFSSRIYGGYATTILNPEPFAYQTGFAVKWLIEQQIDGDPGLDVASGKSPWLTWGPYLWADGLTPRFDGLTWACSELQTDGTHPSPTGQLKVARMLLDFFHSDAAARTWYLAQTSAAPAPSIGAVVNSAGYGAALATGSLVTVFGSNLAGAAAQAQTFPLPRELAGTRVDVDGVPALLYYVSPTQINFVLPAELAQSVTVVRGQTASAPSKLPVGFWGAGLFTLDGTPGGPLAAAHTNGTVVSSTNPARHGETIEVFGTGWGIVNPLLMIPIAAPQVSVGGAAAGVSYIGGAPGLPGVTQINVVVPADAPAGTVGITLQLLGTISNKATVAIAAN